MKQTYVDSHSRFSAPLPGALDGMLVVEIGERTGASVCCTVLAQLGATVVALERKDAMPVPDNMSVKMNWREQMLAGKLSLTPGNDDGDLVKKLLERADVVVTSTDMASPAPGGWAVPHAQVVCNITAMGEGGPDAGHPYCDAQIQALTGMVETTGLPESPPLAVRVPIVEYLCGLHAAGAVLSACRLVEHGGPGQRIDMALYDCAFNAMSSFFSRLLLDGGGDARVNRMGNRHALSAPWNAYQARDGWILICTGSDIQWRRLCELIGQEEMARDPRFQTSKERVVHVKEVDAFVGEWVGRQSQSQCVLALAQASIPGGPIIAIEAYPREPNLEYRGMIRQLEPRQGGKILYAPGSPLRMNRTPGRALTLVPVPDGDRAQVIELIEQGKPAMVRAAPIARPLEGVRVLEIGHYTSAPEGARHLAALGAEVIKIEPPEGEASRGWAPIVRGQSVFYTIRNSDKADISLDLNLEKDRATLRSLIEISDVLIENLKPGTLSKHGFSPLQVAELNPRIVYCAISGFGADSIYTSRPAFDTVVQGMSGLMDVVRSGGVPLKTGISIADVMGAAMSVVAVLGALARRQKSGTGQFIDLSMQDVLAWATATVWNSNRAADAPQVLECAGEHLLVTGGVASTSMPSISRAEAASACVGQNLRSAPVLALNEVLASAQASARRLFFKVEDQRGQWPALAVPLRLLSTPPRVLRPGPPLGQDNATILELLAVQADR